jgi:hypothetical protein
VSTPTFPQLATGALAQFPAQKHVLQRTVINRSPGGSITKMSDPEGAALAWELVYDGLTDAEMTALDTLFRECEGRLRPFEFVDPCGNLLLWTEDLSHDVWQSSLLVTDGVGDPLGGMAAATLKNASQAAQGFAQTVDAPGAYTYTFSVWVRSGSADRVELSLAGASTWRQVSQVWERIAIAVPTDSSGGQIACSVQVPGGSAIDVYGPQLEAQADASGYRRNDDRKSFCLARFDQDELQQTSYGPDNHTTRIRVLKVQEQ